MAHTILQDNSFGDHPSGVIMKSLHKRALLMEVQSELKDSVLPIVRLREIQDVGVEDDMGSIQEGVIVAVEGLLDRRVIEEALRPNCRVSAIVCQLSLQLRGDH